MSNEAATGEAREVTTPRRRWDYELVLVTYYSRSLIETLLSALPDDIPAVIVDNAQGADGMAAVAEGRPSVRYLVGPNKGFPTAANIGAYSSAYERVIFLNPDSKPTVDQLDSLSADLDADPGLAAVGAMTLEPNGRGEMTGGWEPSPARALVHAVGAHKIFPTAGLWARPVPGQPIAVDWMGGACLAVPRGVFQDLGGFDESFFVYSDDVEFGRRIRESPYRQRFRTDIAVPHVGAGSGESKDRMLRFRGGAMTQYLRRYNSGWKVNAVRVLLTAGLAARIPLCRLRGRDAQAREHVSYLRGLWFGSPA